MHKDLYDLRKKNRTWTLGGHGLKCCLNGSPWWEKHFLGNLQRTQWPSYVTSLTVSGSRLLSKTGSQEGRKSEQLCSSSFLWDSERTHPPSRNMLNSALNRPSISVTGVRTHSEQSLTRSKPVHADSWTNKAEVWWIAGPGLTSLTSHLFEPQQFRGLHLRWHDPPHPAQDPMVGVCYTRSLIFSAVVHPHHHVPEWISWTRPNIKTVRGQYAQHVICIMKWEIFKWSFTNICFLLLALNALLCSRPRPLTWLWRRGFVPSRVNIVSNYIRLKKNYTSKTN